MVKEHLTIKHYLKTLEETVRQQWDQKALCDYEGDAYTYADVATSIEQFRISTFTRHRQQVTARLQQDQRGGICGRAFRKDA